MEAKWLPKDAKEAKRVQSASKGRSRESQGGQTIYKHIYEISKIELVGLRGAQ